MTNEQPRPWTQAITTMAATNGLATPEWIVLPMGVLRTPTIAGRFVTMKRRMVNRNETVKAGVLFSFWTESDLPNRLKVSVRRPLHPTDHEASTMLIAIMNWLHGQWTTAQVATTLGTTPEPQMQ